MSNELDPERQEIIGDLLRGAIPVNPASPFVSREEFAATIQLVEEKIESAGLRQRNWVLGGCLSVMIAGSIGYASLVSKLDRLSAFIPDATSKFEARAAWIQRVEHRDRVQDEAIGKLDPDYEPVPYQEMPR